LRRLFQKKDKVTTIQSTPFNSNSIGVFIDSKCSIGKGTVIYPGVFIGETETHKGFPSIGEECTIGPNVAILGGITIGENCIIESGCVVVVSIPPFSTVADNMVIEIKYWDADSKKKNK
jgi:serine acetyltransferase